MPPSTSWAPPPLPREHGAWVMLSLPVVFGVALAGLATPTSWTLPPAFLLAFLAHYTLVAVIDRRLQGKAAPPAWWRRRLLWGAVYLVAALLAFGVTVVLAPGPSRSALLGIAVVAAAAAAVYGAASCTGTGRAVWSELVGMAGLSLSAPMLAVAAGRPLDGRLLAASALAFAYFASSLAFVRAYGLIGERRRGAIAGCLWAHGVLLVGLTVLVGASWMPAWGLAAFVPVLARTVWGLIRPPANLRALGMREIWVATSFAVVGTAALVTSG